MNSAPATAGTITTLPVVLYVHDLRASGVVRKALVLTRHLSEVLPTRLVVGYGAGDLFDEARRDQRAFVALCARRAGNGGRLIAAWRLRRHLGAEPAVVVSMGNFGHPTVFAATRGRPGLRPVYVISNEVGRGRAVSDRLRHAWAGLLVRDAAHTIIVGAQTGTAPTLAAAVACGRASALPNGVDLALAAEKAGARVPHEWLSGTIPVIVAIGRVRPQKNFLFLIEAFAVLRRQHAVRLVILGGGSAREESALLERARTLGVERDVLLAGVTDNVYVWLKHAALFALPSRYEGSSNALLEALAVGTPVVAARCAGDAEQVLGAGLYGALASVDDVERYAAAMAIQLSPQRVLPGARAEVYSQRAAMDAYCQVIWQVAASVTQQGHGGD